MTFLQFSDKNVSFVVFVKQIAAEVVHLLKSDSADPEYVSQRKAFEMFGRANVERWRHQGKVSPCKRPGRVEYRTADLRLLQRTQQEYLEPSK